MDDQLARGQSESAARLAAHPVVLAEVTGGSRSVPEAKRVDFDRGAIASHAAQTSSLGRVRHWRRRDQL